MIVIGGAPCLIAIDCHPLLKAAMLVAVYHCKALPWNECALAAAGPWLLRTSL